MTKTIKIELVGLAVAIAIFGLSMRLHREQPFGPPGVTTNATDTPASAGDGAPTNSAPAPAIPLGQPQTFSVGQSVTYTDGLTVRLDRIDDSRCKAGTVCIWQGELAPVFIVRAATGAGQTSGAAEQEVRLGTVRTNQTVAASHRFVLGDVIATSAQVTVTADASPVATTDPRISVTSPLVGGTVASPLTVTGKARGSWYFEASFPVKLLDADGSVLAQAPAKAQGDWMTDSFVPFTVTLTFVAAKGQTGTLVLEKDNPSGDPKNAAEIRLPVRFGTAGKTAGTSGG